jgi:hypothetical protein
MYIDKAADHVRCMNFKGLDGENRDSFQEYKNIKLLVIKKYLMHEDCSPEIEKLKEARRKFNDLTLDKYQLSLVNNGPCENYFIENVAPEIIIMNVSDLKIVFEK